MTLIDPPWRLDPVKNIVGIGWGGRAVIVFRFKFSTSTAIVWKAFFTGDSNIASLHGVSLTDQIGPIVDPPGPPKTLPPAESIPANNDAWSYPKKDQQLTTTTTETAEVADLLYFVGYIGGGFPFFGGTFATAQDAYDSFAIEFEQLIGRPPVPNDPIDLFVQSTRVVSSHTETQTITVTQRDGRTITFLNAGRIQSRNKLVKDDQRIKLVFRTDGGPATQFIEWEADVAVYVGAVARKFILDSTARAGASPSPLLPPISYRQEKSDYPPESEKPAVEVVFLIRLSDFAITSTQRRL